MTLQAIISAAMTYVPLVVSAAAAAMAVLPQGKPGSTWDNTRSVINYLAMNWGHAKNQVQK